MMCVNLILFLTGECANTGEVSQFIYSVPLAGTLAWEIDATYYLVFYNTGGNVAPCVIGYKFKVFVYNATSMLIHIL